MAHPADDHRTRRQFAGGDSSHSNRSRSDHTQQSTDRAPTNRSSRSSREHTDEHVAFGRWRAQTSAGPLARPLGGLIGSFFKEARRLMGTDETTMQSVIKCLSSEGGLKRIQELIERDFTPFSAAGQKVIFHDEIIPFLEVITFPNVVASLVLEQAVVTMYNCIFGPQGRRAHPFFMFLAEYAESETGNPLDVANHLEMSLLAFSQVIELNSTAFVHDGLKTVAIKFANLLTTLSASNEAISLHKSVKYLERLQSQLDVGLSLPNLLGNLKKVTPVQKPASFVTQRDPPGGRHDNDHENITRIKIMPTFEEITSSRAEYLPVKDPRQWHVNGISGLLDRNFRLLREDTIGQLRDVIHAELWPSPHNKSPRTQTRTHVYKQVTVEGADLHKTSGLQFVVSFSQPMNVRGLVEEKKREEWWSLSKRLQSSALVCLLDPRGFATFCVVYTPPRPNKKAAAIDEREVLSSSLSEDPQRASIILELVEPSRENWQYIFDCQVMRCTGNPLKISLVEFPGILLPSFEPTLLALQQMQKTGQVSMSEYLAPKDLESLSLLTDVPPPIYATSPGFSFDLKCLMNDGTTLKVHPSQPAEVERLQRHSSLDLAQATALVSSLQRRLGLIQGPPGTGKSYTGVALIKVLLANKMNIEGGLGPIICVCYTNHALDQLLEDILKSNITSQIIRIGSQSKSDMLEPLNLRRVAREGEKTRMERRDQWNLHRTLEQQAIEFRKLNLDIIGTERGLKYHLEKIDYFHYNQLFGEDDDGWKRVSNTKSGDIIGSWLRGAKQNSNQPRDLDTLLQVHVDQMTARERRVLYQHWTETQRTEAYNNAHSMLISHAETKTSWDGIRDELDLRCLRDADVVGVTTTGLARSLNMLRRLRSRVLICEEAGEVLEAHLLTSLLPSIEQMVLIGDHQQLRPQIQNYGLSRESVEGKQYALDRSLFERLVNPEDEVGIQIPFCSLETQRRMAPPISRLIRDTLYPRLQDAPSVLDYPEVVGMRKRLFWLDHRYPEGDPNSEDPMTTSHWNNHEVEVTIALVSHLLNQGVYRGGEIAVLTPYLGQLHRIRRRLAGAHAVTLSDRDLEELENAGLAGDDTDLPKTTACKSTMLEPLRVATIDNFQGEEATVVVISLVRSNSQNRCGFLRTPNRINVLLSRAKHGMYIIGNSETARGVEMWGKVLGIMESEGNLGQQLELSCPRHPDTPIAVAEPDHFVQFSPEGGCNIKCGKRLQCGHPCKQKCHSEMLHNVVYCPEPCPRPRKECAHSCPRKCGDVCQSKCLVPTFDANRILPCGHPMRTLQCWEAQDLTQVKCPKIVPKEVPGCKHTVYVACHINVTANEYRCKKECGAALTCGHACKRLCWNCVQKTDEGPKVEHQPCKQKCDRPYTACSHTCQIECHGMVACPPCNSPCDVECGHSKCPRKCSEPCAPCAVSNCLSACPHSACSMPCAAPCDHIPCSLRCESLLSCGHRCPSVCGEICPSVKYCQICASRDIKETPVDFILGEKYQDIDLNENPCIFPRCGHFLTIESMDGQMGIKEHYRLDDSGTPVSIALSSEPFSIDDIRRCATCRGSLRSLSRYGRLVRRALLDEATKKLILYVNQQYVPLAQQLLAALPGLQNRNDADTKAAAVSMFESGDDIKLAGSPGQQVLRMSGIVGSRTRILAWADILTLRRKIKEYQQKVKVDEQPFNQVRNMVEDARRRKKTSKEFTFDESVLQTKGEIQAASLLLRLELALLTDFLGVKKLVPQGRDRRELFINLKENRAVCQLMINDAIDTHRILHQTEGTIFLAQFYILESQHSMDPVLAEDLRKEATIVLDEAQRLCDLNPGQTRGLPEEVEGTRIMLNRGTFYTQVSHEERLEVLQAMAQEFRGTGHWYQCENNHPFTIGECGGAMQMARCPECGAPVGGRNHETAAGVSRAEELEVMIEGLGLDD
ncbi:unnamed protein product [Penicillium olsonii]|nr:unnamed protein product [Penicillium olsonii]